MLQNTFRLVLGIILLISFSLSCSLINTANELRSTAEHAGTYIEQGRELVGTGQALVTNVQGSGIVETAQALATQFDDSGIKETAQAFATQFEDSGYLETAQAYATQLEDSGYLETAQAYATQFGDADLLQTAQAVTTQFGLSPENVPEDIPLFEGEKNAFLASPQAVSYFVGAAFDEVLSFYQREMPAHGWIPVMQGTVVTDSSAELNFEKNGRTAKVVITAAPIIDQTSVVISLQHP